jgi:hypothetical protein
MSSPMWIFSKKIRGETPSGLMLLRPRECPGSHEPLGSTIQIVANLVRLESDGCKP